MGKVKCKVCGFEFAPLKEEHYIARRETAAGIGAITPHVEPEWYDAWDCPVCGAQYAFPDKRFRAVAAEERACDDCCKPEWDDFDCEGCAYEALMPNEQPCVDCARCFEDKFEPAGEADNGDE